mmetsp:Transcript_34184/g.98176  ORF Transcript_34184/g.98176 Transcript_34184/m.98176 type:complete len:412 (+) Transcript_34184:94-1329(+)
MARYLSLCAVAAAPLSAFVQGSSATGDLASCNVQGGAGQCSSSAPTTRHLVASEHLLLQVAGSRLSTALAMHGPQDVGSSGCSGMPDVKRKCSDDGCRVLAGDMVGLTCNEFCHRSGRTCVAAWEEVNDDCASQQVLRCDETYGTTSDLLCMCSSVLVGLSTNAMAVSSSQLIWSDEFDGTEVDQSKWNYETGGGGFGNSELQHYTHHSAQVHDGALRITAKCEEYEHEHYTSAKLTTQHIVSWGPGHRVEVRTKAPVAQGTWPAIWMLPVDDAYGLWPASGEIDIMEAVGCTENKIFGTVHTGAYNHMHNTQAYGSRQLQVAEWHTYALQWEEEGLQWFVDGELFGSFAPTHRSSEKWPFSQDFYLILNLAVGGAWGGSCLHGSGPSCLPGSEFSQGQVMEVDYARVYKI